jgi:predicted DNA-binding protein
MTKRVAITISQKSHATFDKLAALTGKPKATWIAEHIDEVEPQFALMAKHLEAAMKQPEKAKQIANAMLNESIDKASKDIEKVRNG